jgi:3D (Asp-Asp-Asp) domain-containing protein
MADVGVTPYNSSIVPDTGGDSLNGNVNVYYDVSMTGSWRVGFGHTRLTVDGIGG